MNILFAHELQDAWCVPILSITVYDTDTDNVICCDDNGEKKYTIPKEELEKICIIIKNAQMFLFLQKRILKMQEF